MHFVREGSSPFRGTITYNFAKVLYHLRNLLVLTFFILSCQNPSFENNSYGIDHDTRMSWWREARFGLFIHWGLYSIPAGEWNGKKTHGEWIRTTAEIPIEEYNKFKDQFNPKAFDADEWVQLAKRAGMKYIVITSKHHDGFSLFDSKYSDFDVMSTPFQTDIMDELATACRKYGLKICWYYSIMDWHHPDYLPRRSWESRPADGAQYERYVSYMKNQLKELIENYGDIGVLWFDGEWEGTWDHDYGKDLYDYVRTLQPNIIVNNRVDIGRSGMGGMTSSGGYVGDFGTPEQEIPSTGIPGVDWETCMTMNTHWGYNKSDDNWKSSKDLVQKLVDIASKGGNFLLNVGPTSEGILPEKSVKRLEQIGKWMRVNSESIYGTSASPFKTLSWGRCTQKVISGGTRLFLHVFSWPEDERLVLPGIYNNVNRAFLLSNKGEDLNAFNENDNIVIRVPKSQPDSFNTVIVLDLIGKPDVNDAPIIDNRQDIFIDEKNVSITTERENVDIFYTIDGTRPSNNSQLISGSVLITETSLVTAQNFRDGSPVSGLTQALFTKVEPISAVEIDQTKRGLRYQYFEGSWDFLPDFESLEQLDFGVISSIDISKRFQDNNFGFVFEGFILIKEKGVYTFYTDSDDGSQLFIWDDLVVDNDGLHSMKEVSGSVALSAGHHPIRVTYFEKNGGNKLNVYLESMNIQKQPIPDNLLSHR